MFIFYGIFIFVVASFVADMATDRWYGCWDRYESAPKWLTGDWTLWSVNVLTFISCADWMWAAIN